MLVQKELEHFSSLTLLWKRIRRLEAACASGLKNLWLRSRKRSFDFFRKGLCIIDPGLHFRFRPFEMPGRAWDITSVALNEEQYFPHRKSAALDVGLPARGESRKSMNANSDRLRPSSNQPSAGITGCPSMTIGHALETVFALCWQAHTDDNRTRLFQRPLLPRCKSCKHCSTPARWRTTQFTGRLGHLQ